MTAALAGTGPTIGDCLAATIALLARAGVPEARADAEVLCAHAFGTTRAGLVAGARDDAPAPARAALDALVARRLAREPVHHLVGVREFWSLPFAVDARVLVPRPETELVVETALAVAPGAPRIVDVGTGSGAIAVALARELPDAAVWAIDRSRDALAVACGNVARHAPRVVLLAGDLTTAVGTASVDLVAANLPYVPDGDVAGLAPEVRDHEPRAALAGGPDGLALVRALVADAPRVLAPRGWLVLELGAGQAPAVVDACSGIGWFDDVRVVRDVAGIERVVAARRKEGGWIRS